MQAVVGVRRGPYLAALLLLSLFAWAPLLYPGYLQVHSGFLPLFNLADLAASSQKLTWLPTIGATPGLLRGEGPLVYWLALLLRPLAGDIGALKGLFAPSFMAIGLGIFAWAQHEFSPGLADVEGDSAQVEDSTANPQSLLAARAGLLAAAVAMLWPPLLAAVYVRGALAETLFMAVLAWALWGVSGVKAHATRARHVVSTGLLVIALFWTQAGLAIWATALLLAWALWPGAPRRNRGVAAAAVAAGALLGGGLFALLHRGQGLEGAALDVAGHAARFYQFFSPAWGFGVSTSGWQDGLPLQLGFAALGLASLTIVLGFGKASRSSRVPWPVLRFAAIAAPLLILLTTTLARPLWELDPLAAAVTYPWQLYALAGPLLALLAGGALAVERRLAVLPLWAATVALVVLSSYPYLAPRFTQVTPDPSAPAIFGANQVTFLNSGVQHQAPAAAPEISSSRVITVTAAWQVLQPIDFDYNIFIHALDATGNRVAQWDGQPQRAGEPYPMTLWTVGEVVQNSYRLELDAAAAPVQRVDVGLYNWQTGERLPVNGDDKVTQEVGP